MGDRNRRGRVDERDVGVPKFAAKRLSIVRFLQDLEDGRVLGDCFEERMDQRLAKSVAELDMAVDRQILVR